MQPLPRDSVIVLPDALLVDPSVDPLLAADDPVADRNPEPAVVPVVAGLEELPVEPAPAVLPDAPLEPDVAPLAEVVVLPDRPEVVMAPDALSAEIISVMPGITLKVRESPMLAALLPLVAEAPDAVEPEAALPGAEELLVAPPKVLPLAPEITILHGALVEAGELLELAAGEELLVCA